MTRKLRCKSRRPNGQAIVEYSACIAFVCCMIALAFRLTQGGLFSGISDSYSSVSGSLTKLNQAALSAGN
jgi:hypothetical protein